MTRKMKPTAYRQIEVSKVERLGLSQTREVAWRVGFEVPSIRLASKLSLAVLVFGLMCALPMRVTAQTALFMGARFGVGSNWNNPTGVVVDRWGNLYVADSSFDTQCCVLKLPAGGGAPIVVGSGLEGPSGLALDAAGDLFIADPVGRQLVELPADGGEQRTIVSPLQSVTPTAVAIESSGEILFVDATNQKVWRILPAVGHNPQHYQAVGTGLIQPTGVAVNSEGDVFISDAGREQVLDVPANGGAEFSIATGLIAPSGVAVDSRGNVFISDTGDVRTNRVIQVPPIGSGGAQTTVLTGLQNPAGVAIDGNGNLFVADAYLGALANPGEVLELQTRSINFGSASVCDASQSTQASCSVSLIAPIVLLFGASGTSKALTLGATNQDFTVTGTTCGTHSDLPYECFITVTFSPKRPGPRSGALQITDGAGGPVLLTVPLSGVGSGPLVGFTSSGQTQTKIAASGLENPTAIASDGNGNLYIADANHNRVVKVPGNGGAQTTVGTGLANPLGVAVDGAGNVFIADWGNKRVVKVSPQGVQTTVDTGSIGAAGVAVDGAGNIFVSDYPNNRVVEVPASGAALTTIGTGLKGPRGIAVDALGQVFIASSDNGLVVEIAIGGTQISIGKALNSPYGVALDAAGDVFIADYGASEVVEVPRGGESQFTMGTGFTNPDGISVDGSGNVFVADTGNARVLKLPLTSPPKLSFATTTPGTSSSSGPKTVVMQNIGNAILHLASLSSPADFSSTEDASPSDPLCVSVHSLSSGSGCSFVFGFNPVHAGLLNESMTITDDNLNVQGATQSIALSGSANGPVATFSAGYLSFGNIYVGSASGTKSLVLTNTGNETLTITGIQMTGDATSYTFISTCKASLAPGVSCSFSGYFKPTSNGNLPATLVISNNTPAKSWGIELEGAGIAAPFASLSVTSLTFATTFVGQSSAMQQAVLTNTGNLGMVINSIVVTGADSSSFVFTNNCGSWLAVGAQCEISGYFAPKAIGPLSASISITDAASNGVQSIALSGTGIAAKISR